MSYPKTKIRDYPGLETIDTWTSPEVLGMSEDVRLDYENKKKAIDLYRNGNPLKAVHFRPFFKPFLLFIQLTIAMRYDGCIAFPYLITIKLDAMS